MKSSFMMVCLLFTMGVLANTYTFKLIQGPDLKNEIEHLAHQRLILFKEYPYLYHGTLEQEIEYCSWFCDLSTTALAIAYCDDKPVGLVSGTSFVDFSTHFIGSYDLFKSASLAPETFFYVAEVLIHPMHRDKQVATQLFALIETYAHEAGYTNMCLVEESHAQHPLKPLDYKSLDPFFTKLGYSKTNLQITYSWSTIQIDGSLQDEEHSMNYWIKNL